MSSGGMDWAYRMIAAHSFDPLGLAVVMHLGWRDHKDLRTDRGIAKALNQHRSAIRNATAKLQALGVITRRSGQWVACETVAIVEQRPDARRPSKEAQDRPENEAGQSVARASQWPTRGPVSGPQEGQSVAHKRKEKKEKGARATTGAHSGRSASPHDAASRPSADRGKAPAQSGGADLAARPDPAGGCAGENATHAQAWRKASTARALGQRWRNPLADTWHDAETPLPESAVALIGGAA